MTALGDQRLTNRATGLPPALHYALYSASLTARNVAFVVFTIIMPVTLYLVFSAIYGGQSGTGLASAMIMVSMAAYGSLGAAMTGGAQLALERRSGWFRQLMITSVPPRHFLWARAGVTMFLVLPALLLVFVAGAFLGGVTATAGQWLASLGLLWIGLLPMTVLGVVVGVWVKAEAVQGATTMLLLALSLLGGLWFPVDAMPPIMAAVAPVLPTYWLGELGRFPFLPAADFPWAAIWVLPAWTIALTGLGALGYRRAAATSKR
jgi:ABC-2 type transport system permease protein